MNLNKITELALLFGLVYEAICKGRLIPKVMKTNDREVVAWKWKWI
jgi:hypothetical protein